VRPARGTHPAPLPGFTFLFQPCTLSASVCGLPARATRHRSTEFLAPARACCTPMCRYTQARARASGAARPVFSSLFFPPFHQPSAKYHPRLPEGAAFSNRWWPTAALFSSSSYY